MKHAYKRRLRKAFSGGPCAPSANAKRLSTWRHVCADYMEVCSVGYMSLAFGNYMRLIRCMWLIATLIGIAATFIHCYMLVDTYLQYGSKYDSQMARDDASPFPGVTVCSGNALMRSRLACDKYLATLETIESELPADAQHSHYWRGVGTFTQANGTGGGSAGRFSARHAAFAWVRNYGERYAELVRLCAGGNVTRGPNDGEAGGPNLVESARNAVRTARRLADLTDVKQTLGVLPPDLIEKAGYKLDDLIYECSFDEVDCTKRLAKYFTTRMDRVYGYCHTFNSLVHRRRQGLPPLTTNEVGSANGLRLTLNVHSAEYYGIVSHEVGIRLIVHGASVRPDPPHQGFMVPPEANTMVEVTRSEVKLLKAPYKGNCTDALPDEYLAQLRAERLGALADFDYEPDACRQICVHLHTVQLCNCTADPALADMAGIDMCDLTLDEQMACAEGVARRHRGQQLPPLRCHCNDMCEQTVYYVRPSIAKWPSVQYQRLKMVNFLSGGHEDKVAQHLYKRTKEGLINEGTDLVRLNVFIKSKHYEVIEEQAAYPIENLLADLGGVLGLYLGMSLLTLVEFVHLAITIAHWLAHRKEQRDRGEQSGDNAGAMPLS